MQAKILAALFALIAFPAFAQSSETPRYQLISVSGGFVRLDTVTGVMTFCRDEVDSFRCGPISANAGEGEMKPDTGAEQKEGSRRERGFKEPSSTEDFDRALSMMERVMRSFMAITQEKQKECAL